MLFIRWFVITICCSVLYIQKKGLASVYLKCEETS